MPTQGVGRWGECVFTWDTFANYLPPEFQKAALPLRNQLAPLLGQRCHTCLVECGYTLWNDHSHCRVHFFGCDVKILSQTLHGLTHDPAWKAQTADLSYRGYATLRPTFPHLGRTIISAPRPPQDDHIRYHTEGFRQHCEGNVHGFRFEIPNALAWLQQDQRWIRCGGATLWHAFQVAQDHFGTPKAPSPQEIHAECTRTRLKSLVTKQFDSRGAPNKALTDVTEKVPPENFKNYQLLQMDEHLLYVLRDRHLTGVSKGLDLTPVDIKGIIKGFGYTTHFEWSEKSDDSVPFRSYCYAYLAMAFPVILACRPSYMDDDHALLLTGHSMLNPKNLFHDAGSSMDEIRVDEYARFLSNSPRVERLMRPPNEFLVAPSNTAACRRIGLKGRRVLGFHAHDDQAGPYQILDAEISKEQGLRLRFRNTDRTVIPLVALPVVPQEAEVSFKEILELLPPLQAFVDIVCRTHEEFAYRLRSAVGIDLQCVQLDEWDIFLCRAKYYKTFIRKQLQNLRKERSLHISDAVKSAESYERLTHLLEMVTRHRHPQYFWRVAYRVRGRDFFECIFDAKRAANGSVDLHRVTWYSKDAREGALQNLFQSGPALRDFFVEIHGHDGYWEKLRTGLAGA